MGNDVSSNNSGAAVPRSEVQRRLNQQRQDFNRQYQEVQEWAIDESANRASAEAKLRAQAREAQRARENAEAALRVQMEATRRAQAEAAQRAEAEAAMRAQAEAAQRAQAEANRRAQAEAAQRAQAEAALRAQAEKALADVALRAQAAQTPPQSVPMSQSDPRPQSVTMPQSAQFVQDSLQVTKSQGYNLERERTPYNYAQEDLQIASRSNMYPKRNDPLQNDTRPPQDFVFVNKSGRIERPRPSAPSTSNRDRSASRARNKCKDNEYNCQTCNVIYTEQIYQCSNGHSSCNTCKDYYRPCGICGANITNTRNFALEAFIVENRVTCPNNNEGCTLSFKMSEMHIHVKECPFSEMKCPLNCSWKGPLKLLSGHFDSSHPQQRTAKINSEMRIPDVLDMNRNIYLVLHGVFNFLFHVKVSDGIIYMAVQMIGTKVSAAKWSYEIQVYKKSDPHRKFMFTDTCTSHVVPISEIYNRHNCSVIPRAYASRFMNAGSLTYKLYIKKSVNNNQPKDFGTNDGKKQRWRKNYN